MVASACGGGSSSGDGDGDLVPAAVQELAIGVAADPWVDAEGDRKRRPNYPLNADVCETLVRLGTDFELEPSVASSWELMGDNTFRFTLEDGTTFSDGRPVTAEDVEYSIDYTVEEPSIGFSFLGPDSTAIVDERTVDVTPEDPNLRLVEQINHPTYSILTPGDDPLNDPNVTCTGPFKVVSYSAEEELVVERNENYWGEPAKLAKITFRFYPDDTTRVLALQNGEVDLINDVPQGILSSLEGLSGIEIMTSPVGNVTLMYVARRDAEGNSKLLADPLLRRAVAASMDTESYVNGVLDGNAEVVDTIAPPAVLGDYADISTPNQNDANPAFLLSLRWYSKASGANAQIISPGPDTTYESLIDQTQQAPDREELQRLAAEAMHELVDVEVAGIPLAGGYRILAMRSEVEGLQPHPSGTNQRWSTVYLSE